MQQVIRRKVIVESKGRIRVQATGLPEGTTAEVLVIVDSKGPKATEHSASELRESIAAYAAKHGGTEADLDSALERSATEFLTNSEKGKRR